MADLSVKKKQLRSRREKGINPLKMAWQATPTMPYRGPQATIRWDLYQPEDKTIKNKTISSNSPPQSLSKFQEALKTKLIKC